MKRCPICSAKIDRHKLMCAMDWKLVPASFQAAVMASWNAYRAEVAARNISTAPRLLKMANALREAQQTAIDSVRLLKAAVRK